ncbi:MAG: phosphatase PAP2 family protein [Bellilinea sp.]|jgi:membrane-associated phospholipid phosphatase
MDGLMLLELTISHWLQSWLGWLKPFFTTITFLGNEEFYLLIIPFLFWCVDTGLGLRIGIMLIASNTINSALKLAFHSPRPYWVDGTIRAMISETSFGLPSGHAQNAASLWGLAASKVQLQWAWWIAGVLIFFIGISRLVLGVHFLRDVLLGWIVGFLLLVIFLRFERKIIAWFTALPVSRQFTAALGSAIGIMLVGLLIRMGISAWQLPQTWLDTALAAAPEELIDPLSLNGFFTVGGTWFGLLMGVILLLRRGGLVRTDGSVRQRAFRFAVGLIGLLVLYVGLGAIFPREPDLIAYGFRFFRYALIGFWVSAAAPLTFLRLGLAQRVP